MEQPKLAVGEIADNVVETRLPVAGTWITEYDMHGRWTVNVYLDDAVRPTTSAPFTFVK